MIRKISEESSIALDFFRGISAQFVLIGHLLSFFGLQSEFKIPIIQNFGVLVFFILSGFLITQTTFLKDKSYGLKNYLIDRVSRIYFSFIPAIFLILIIDNFIKLNGHYNTGYVTDLKNLIANILQLQAYPYISKLGIEAFGSARPFWTVSIEFWLYMTFGYIYYIIVSKLKANVFQTVIFIISLPLAFYYILGRGEGLTIYWFLGFLLAVAHNKILFKVNSS
ncbi:acyltransferase family protein, partial [Kaistella sp.]|uniref:acyltransferase family protein n=1 Tax=Kaistella sp. TaxID=2782235 RepID=UPI002F927AB0